MKVAVFSTKPHDKVYFKKQNKTFGHDLSYFEERLNSETAHIASGFNAVCIFVNDKVSEDVIQQLGQHGVRIIALRCSGYNNVNLSAAFANNIKVVRVPAYSPEAIAEHAVALILTLNRKTHKAYQRIKDHNFSIENLTGFNLKGKTVGVIGTGNIGTAFCKIMLGFGCKLIAYDPEESENLKQIGVIYKPFDEVLSQSDILSLHCPLNAATCYLIDEKAFAKMKNGAMLINTSRGAIVKTEAAIQALQEEKLAYLGIDVYEHEAELFFEDLSDTIIKDELFLKLIDFPNVLITSHQGFFTAEALDQIAITTLKNLENFENRILLANEVKG